MKITIDLNREGSIEDAIRRLEKAKQDIEELVKDIVKELATAGAEVAKVNFADAEYAGLHSEQISFKLSDNGKKATVYADGRAVLFIEFGTGILKQPPVGEYDEIISGSVVDHGEYGWKQGSSPYGWWYRGVPGIHPPGGTAWAVDRGGRVHTYGNDANSSMYRARREIEKRYEDIVRSVWERRNRT